MLVRAAKVMGEGLGGGASLMEDYTYNLVPGQEMILGAHMLEVCPSLTTARPRIEIHPLSIGGKEDPVRMVFDADPGTAVVVAMADMRDRFRLTANVVDVIAPPHPMPSLPVARAMWVPRPDFSTSVEAWLTAGGAHHTCMSTQIGVGVWEFFALLARSARGERRLRAAAYGVRAPRVTGQYPSGALFRRVAHQRNPPVLVSCASKSGGFSHKSLGIGVISAKYRRIGDKSRADFVVFSS